MPIERIKSEETKNKLDSIEMYSAQNDMREERLIAIIESQQRTIENLSKKEKDIVVGSA